VTNYGRSRLAVARPAARTAFNPVTVRTHVAADGRCGRAWEDPAHGCNCPDCRAARASGFSPPRVPLLGRDY
jgi:hypothetical protein